MAAAKVTHFVQNSTPEQLVVVVVVLGPAMPKRQNLITLKQS